MVVNQTGPPGSYGQRTPLNQRYTLSVIRYWRYVTVRIGLSYGYIVTAMLSRSQLDDWPELANAATSPDSKTGPAEIEIKDSIKPLCPDSPAFDLYKQEWQDWMTALPFWLIHALAQRVDT